MENNSLPQEISGNVTSRRLLNESHSVFSKLYFWSNENENKLALDELVQASREYRSILRSAVLSLEESLSGPATVSTSEVQNLLSIYRSEEVVWSLVEGLCLKPKGSNITLDLIEWGQWNFVQADVWIVEIMRDHQSANSTRVESHPKYWDALYLFTLMGRCEEASQLLSVHPRSGEEAFRSVLELLQKIPLAALGVDVLEWKQWKGECDRRLYRKHFEAHPELERIVKILVGDESGLSEVSGLLESWYEAMIPLSLYKHSEKSALQLQDLIEEAFQLVPDVSSPQEPDESSPRRLRPLDSILCAVFELDLLRVLKELSANSADWWLTAHLADLLSHAGCADLASLVSLADEETDDSFQSNKQISLRELLVLDYGKSLMATPGLWQIGVVYLDSCETLGAAALESALTNMALNSEKQLLKILRIFDQHGMNEARRNLCRKLSLDALKADNLSVAMGWCISAKDPGFAGFMAEEFLKREDRGSLMQGISLLDQLGDTLLMSPSLVFLGKYREFQILLEEAEKNEMEKGAKLKKAAALLCDLIVSKIAPRSFWGTLLLDAVPLLSKNMDEIPILNVEQSHQLMNVLQSISDEIEIAKSTSFFKTEIQRKEFLAKTSEFRRCLVKNLASAIVYF